MTSKQKILKAMWPDHFASSPVYQSLVRGRTGAWEYRYDSPLNPGSYGGSFRFNDGAEPTTAYFISVIAEDFHDA